MWPKRRAPSSPPQPPSPKHVVSPLATDIPDTHYTPSTVAKALVRAMHDLQPALIADLAAGNGDLLIEAERVWPNANFVATDIDRRAIRRLARRHPSWTVGRCDLRNARSRASCQALNELPHASCLIVLNPPFSCRGGTRFMVQTPDGPLYASTAMSFLLLAASYVSASGHIVSVLPLGCLHNVKDVRAWNYLKSRYAVTVIDTYANDTFPNSTASTVIVRFSPPVHEVTTTTPRPATLVPESRFRVGVIRGSCPVHRIEHETQKPVLVHYTDIRDGAVTLNGRRGFGSFRSVKGPAILIPRVGRITSGKIGLLETNHLVMPSDCVIALKPESIEHARTLRCRLVGNLEHLRAHYTGTGAPFITVARLKAALETIGVDVDEPC